MTLEEIAKEVASNKKIDSEKLYQEAQKYLQGLPDEEKKKQKMRNWHLLEMLGMMKG